jgi:ADP-heptose:LPS heptosyltransferase
MNIDLMRNIDFYVGVPLCFLMTCVDFVISPFRSKNLPKPNRVLFIELSEMGSTILADPSMRRIKAAGCELYFLIFKKNEPSLHLLKTVNIENVFVLRESSFVTLLWDTLRFVIWCRKNRIDSCIDLELFSRVTSLLTWASMADNRVGFYRYHQEGLYRGEFLTHKVPYNAHAHIAHNFMNLVESLLRGVDSDGFLKRPLQKEDLIVAKAKISDISRAAVKHKISESLPGWTADRVLVLVNANAGEFLPQRKWPQEYFVCLIQLLLEQRPEVYVLLTGAPAERAENDQVANAVSNPRCVNFSGSVAFEELPTLYDIAKVLITNDSGPGHFSSVTGIRSFVFFGPETPSLYGSLGNSSAFYSHAACSPCVSATNHRKTKCTDNQCLKVIKPEMVIKEILAVI